MPYYCPGGWTRFSLRVCADEEFGRRFDNWCYLYHGTKGRFVGPILTSGFRASRGLCYCGETEQAVYMSPSIEYSSHPRYGSVEFNPETKQWMQVVLQCRCDLGVVWQKKSETLHCKQFGLVPDANWSNDTLEWLFKPNFVDEQGRHYVQDAIVCTGIMVRVTDRHPLDTERWWSMDEGYVDQCRLRYCKVEPLQLPRALSTWSTVVVSIERCVDRSHVDLLDDHRLTVQEFEGSGRMSPSPFAAGSMRLAWFLESGGLVYVAKRYNQETLRFLTDALDISEKRAFEKDVCTYLVASRFASRWNRRSPGCRVRFVEPMIARINGEAYFCERFVEGKFVKWNTNTGLVNHSPEAVKNDMGDLSASFCHFTFVESKGQVMLVDVQGWESGGEAVFTDPQLHTRSFKGSSGDRQSDALYRKFSIGNLGRTGMMHFWLTHRCCGNCRGLGLQHPLRARVARLGGA